VVVVNPLPDKQSVDIAFDQHWLCKYARHLQCIHETGSEFVGMEFQEMHASYGITSIITTVTNPQANAIIECIHQVIANMLHTSNPLVDPETTQLRIEQQLHATQWAINTTYHTTLKASPAQLVFGRDMILQTIYLANWAAIKYL
jgi:adenosyl cobinamide kinase/adenosyl cobinamide phosphate guanylyltransferase